MLKIGNLKLKSNLILAPMSGISDLPYRLLSRKFGAELAFVEMINCRSLSHKSKKTKHMLTATSEDNPLGVQILGSDPKFLKKSLEIINKYNFDVLDFNAACPEKKVVRRGEGASLLRDPQKLNTLLKILVKESKFPVTVKIRIGWDSESVNAKDVALAAQDAGIKALFIHGRTKTQGYSGMVNYDAIREARKVTNIPFVASGDVFSAGLAKKMFDETGCDGLLVARGALGNPWLFREIKAYLKNGKIIPRPAHEEIIATAIEHLNSCVDFYGEKIGVIIFRKFFSWYNKGFSRVRPLREKASQVRTKDEFINILQACLRINPS